MCGIVGIASVKYQNEREWLITARDMMIHRGPDDKGVWWSDDGHVGMAHRRLSIVDLSFSGHQPMHFKNKRLTIVFNGEIYNHTDLRRMLQNKGYEFISNSDTEVLLASYAEWGTSCLNYLNGMFAFALYDTDNTLLFMARDRAGEKPLFYRNDGNSIYFASELKALLSIKELPRSIDPESLDCYLSMGYVPGNRCILSGYRKLPAAHAMTYNLRDNKEIIWQYWKMPESAEKDSECDNESLLAELENLLEDAVGRQMVADVPVGVLLSGGVDSSLITAMAVRRSSNVHTFSIGFPGHSREDETAHARFIARHFGTEHIELMAEPSSVELFPVLARQFDEPMVDSSMFPTWLVSNLVRNHCTVALGGDGGDELFGGYPMHQRLLWLEKHMNKFPMTAKRIISTAAELIIPAGYFGRNYMTSLGYDLNYEVPDFQKLYDIGYRRKLLPQNKIYVGYSEKIRKKRYSTSNDLLYRATKYDFENYLAEDILVKVDRASMLNSLEVRAPFLDYRIIEFAFSKVPSRLKATSIDKKIMLKNLTTRLLPPEFDRQRKQGFSIPLSQWLKKGPFREMFWSVLLSKDCIFDKAIIKRLINDQDKGRNNGERLFALVLFELWRQIYKVSI